MNLATDKVQNFEDEKYMVERIVGRCVCLAYIQEFEAL